MEKQPELIKKLIPFDYCTPDRAARFLECDVEDIFQWYQKDVINLRVFLDFDTDVAFRKLEVYGPLPATLIHPNHPDNSFEEVIVSNELLKSNYGKDELLMAPSFSYDGPQGRISYDKDEVLLKFPPQLFMEFSKATDDEITAVLSGFWGVYVSRTYLDKIFKPGCANDLGPELLTFYAYFGDAEVLLKDVQISNFIDVLFISKDDILKIQKAILQSNEKHYLPEELTNKERGGERTTAKQCVFIVSLLRSLGLTDDDFKGSIGALRKKISIKSKWVADLNLDDKTLAEWLKRGGVR